MVNQGFTSLQKTELKQIISTSFVDLFKEIVQPSLDNLLERLDKVENRMAGLEERMSKLEDKVDSLRVEVYDLKRRVKDLEMNTVEMRSYLNLRQRVVELERKTGLTN